MRYNITRSPSDHQVGFFIALCCVQALFALPISGSVEWTGCVYDGENNHIGEPILPGASVSAEILSHGRDKKILVYKKKRRKGYQRKNGHRQWFTELEFKSIIVPKTKIKSTPSENVSPAIEVNNQEEE